MLLGAPILHPSGRAERGDADERKTNLLKIHPQQARHTGGKHMKSVTRNYKGEKWVKDIQDKTKKNWPK